MALDRRGGKRLPPSQTSKAGRLGLPKAKFALPTAAEEKRRGMKGRYPLDIVARGAQNASPAELVRRAVAREYPGIEQRAKGKK